MEQMIKVVPERVEKSVSVNREPFLLAESQTKTVPLSMANGDQIISPDAGKLLSQVTVVCPATYVEENIREGVNIGGKVGTYAGVEPPPLDNPAGAGQIFVGYDAINDRNERVEGTFAIPSLSNPAGAGQIVQGYDGINDNNERVVGTLNPDAFEFPLLNVYHTLVTVGTNSANTVQKVKDYLYSLLGITETNRLFAATLRATSGFVTNEVGRIVQYPNSNNWTIAQYSSARSWVAGSMSSAAVLPVGRQYDLFWWQVPANVPT